MLSDENLPQDQPSQDSSLSEPLGGTSLAENGASPVAVSPSAQTQPKNDGENPWLEVVKTVGLSIILALGIRTFVAEARWIPSGSMKPTLLEEDRLIVDKVSYHFQQPQRGDIVVFSPTDALKKQSYKDAFIKRIVGTPGDKVEITNGRVYINGAPLKESYIAEAPDYQWGPKVVPPDSYLVLGDNRNNSYDSHYWGFVPRDRIIGRAVVRFWPPQRVGGIERPTFRP